MELLENLAFGLPVVNFDCDTGPAEVLEDKDSILAPKNDVNNLTLSLIKLINNDEQRKVISDKSKKKAEVYQPKNIVS